MIKGELKKINEKSTNERNSVKIINNLNFIFSQYIFIGILKVNNFMQMLCLHHSLKIDMKITFVSSTNGIY